MLLRHYVDLTTSFGSTFTMQYLAWDTQSALIDQKPIVYSTDKPVEDWSLQYLRWK